MIFRALLTTVLLMFSTLALADDKLPLAELIRLAPSQGQFIERDGRDVSSGIVVLGRGGELRWERQQPYEELLLANQTQAWHIQPDLNQAIMLDVRAVSSWRALLDPSMLSRHYKATTQEGVITLRRVAKANSEQWPNMDISLDAKGQLKQITFVEDKERIIEFSDWRPAPRARFDYTPPAGMDVIGRP